jgi:uncharacterized repeat protein (TIGR01451 family)
VTGGNGAIAPSTPQTIDHGATTSFTLTPAANYHVGSVTGTCGGNLAGNVYTTNAVTADCTVIASFAIDTHTVTPSVTGGNGAIAPSTPQTVTDGNTTSFTLTPDSGYAIGSVTGCGGNLAGNVYTTGPITADCTVNASFAAVPDVAVTIDDGRAYAQYGMSLSYTVTISNPGSSAVGDVSISNAFPPELDINAATWTCSGGGGAVCTPNGSGALTDSGVTVPASGSVVYTLTAPVRANASSGQVANQVTVTGPSGSHNATDQDTLVILRAGFESGDDGANAPSSQPNRAK